MTQHPFNNLEPRGKTPTTVRAIENWIQQAEGDPLNDLDYLVASGQATICYNLMRFLWEECRGPDGWLDAETGKLFGHAVNEWKKLINDPLSLLNDRKRRSRLPELNAQAAAALKTGSG